LGGVIDFPDRSFGSDLYHGGGIAALRNSGTEVGGNHRYELLMAAIVAAGRGVVRYGFSRRSAVGVGDCSIVARREIGMLGKAKNHLAKEDKNCADAHGSQPKFTLSDHGTFV